MQSFSRVVFQLTKKCNLACSHCFFNSGQDKNEKLTLSQAIKALLDLYKLGIKKIDTIILTGGEPTIWPHLSALLINIKKLFPKTKIRIDTNGVNFLVDPKLFGVVKADIYDISVDNFHNQSAIDGKFKNKNIFVKRDGSSPLVDIFLNNQAIYKFGLSVRWTSNRQDDHLFNKFVSKYKGKVDINKKLVTATGRGKNLPSNFTDLGYLIKEKPENFACLMGNSLLLAIDGFWYGCYHPVSLTKLGKVGSQALIKNFKKLINNPLYKNLPKQGLLKVLEEIKKKNPKQKEAIDKVLAKKYWYRCEPCEYLCALGIFKK